MRPHDTGSRWLALQRSSKSRRRPQHLRRRSIVAPGGAPGAQTCCSMATPSAVNKKSTQHRPRLRRSFIAVPAALHCSSGRRSIATPTVRQKLQRSTSGERHHTPAFVLRFNTGSDNAVVPDHIVASLARRNSHRPCSNVHQLAMEETHLLSSPHLSLGKARPPS